MTCESPDAIAQPFGACLHLDHWIMKHGSDAAKSAKFALHQLDEKTGFKGLAPSNSRAHLDVKEQIFQFEGVEDGQQARRWWTDCAPEFRAASREIRKLRPLAHFTSVPHRPQSNGIIERSNRVVIEGTNASIFGAGADGKWWVCAAPYWVMMYNGFLIGKDGQTAWERRFGVSAAFKQYPWGTLVFVKPPKALEKSKGKFLPKMSPHLLVGIGIGPGYIWNKTYAVVKLSKLLGDRRASRACVRHTCDIMFPDVPSFPLKLKLNASGALGDANMPGPAVPDDDEPWKVQEISDDSSTDDDQVDGSLGENAPRLQSDYVEAIIIDPEDAVPEDSEDERIAKQNLIDDVNADPAPLQDEEVVPDGKRAPRGWRIDTFGSRSVSVPPWSRRPPDILPEDWMMLSRKDQITWRNDWQLNDQVNYDIQEARRAQFLADKNARRMLVLPIQERDETWDAEKIPSVPVLQQHVELEVENFATLESASGEEVIHSLSVDMPQNPDEDSTSLPVYNGDGDSKRRSQTGAIDEFKRHAKEKMLTGKYDRIFIEMCCEDDSELSKHVGQRTLAIRATKNLDCTNNMTIKALHSIIRTARHMSMSVHVWVAIPCTAGCMWKHVNKARGFETGDSKMTDELVRVAIGLGKHAVKIGGSVHWEWPKTSDLWKRDDVQQFLKQIGAETVDVSTAAAGMSFTGKDGSEVFLKKCWRIASTHEAFREALQPLSKVPDSLGKDDFVQCNGQKAKDSANYTALLAKTFWNSIVPKKRVISASALQRVHAQMIVQEHEELWPSLVVRQIGLKTPEGKSAPAIAAREKELAGHRRRGTWDESTVTEYRDLMRDSTKKEIMCGRVFGILGNKNDECDLDQQAMKYRAVFQGSNIRTKTGISAIDLFEEVSSAPASFTAIRCALAAAVLRKLTVTVRDALQAYLQARINTPDRIETWVELPEEFWPDAWYFDGAARAKPKFTRPMVLLILALYGHPESGALWEALLSKALTARGWHTIAEWPGVYIHSDLSVLVVYVDDLMLCTTSIEQENHWKSIDEAVEFKEPPAPIARFIGAQYELTPFAAGSPLADRELSIDMRSYVKNMANRFSTESGIKLRTVSTPFLPDDQWAVDDDTPGRFSTSCASFAATSLFVSRVARPDLSNITQRLCSAVARWTVVHDAALVRLMSYCSFNSELVLKGKLSPNDLHEVRIVPYSDADWSGDASTTKSTTGIWVELEAPTSGNTWPLSWGATLQTSTASATAEAETVAASHVFRREAIPIQILFEQMLGKRLDIVLQIDNMQAISAIEKGYSKKLRHLLRTQRVCIGLLHECLNDEELQFFVVHCPTLVMKGDLFTKALCSPKFVEALRMIRLEDSAAGKLQSV